MAKLRETALGFDFGMRRIGVAVGQTVTRSARPLPVLLARRGIPDWDDIAKLIKYWSAQSLVVGLPYNRDGSEQLITKATRQFSADLEGKFDLPVHLIDERFTTQAARSEFGALANSKGETIDSYAAQLILEDWLRALDSLNGEFIGL